MSPPPKSHRAATGQHVKVDPTSLILPEDPAHLEPEDEFVDSVRRDGVLMPPLVVQDRDGVFVVVAGRRRVMAARRTDEAIMVRIVNGDSADIARLAFVEDHFVGQRRSTVEQAWMVGAYVRAVQASGGSVTARSLATEFHVAVGKAHYWMAIARGLPPDRAERLAARVGADPSRLRGLPVRRALELASTPDDGAAENVLRAFLGQTSPPADPTEAVPLGWVRRILHMLMAWLHAIVSRVHSDVRPRSEQK